jgi:hypothetical protein
MRIFIMLSVVGWIPVLTIWAVAACGSKSNKKNNPTPAPQPQPSNGEILALAPKDLVLSAPMTTPNPNEFAVDLGGKKSASIAFTLQFDADYRLELSSVYRRFTGCTGGDPDPTFTWQQGDSGQGTEISQEQAFTAAKGIRHSLVVAIDNTTASCKSAEVSFVVTKRPIASNGGATQPQEPGEQPAPSGLFKVPLKAGFALMESRTDGAGCAASVSKTMADLLFKPGNPSSSETNSYEVDTLGRSLEIKFYYGGLFRNFVTFEGQPDAISAITDLLLSGAMVKVTKQRGCVVAGSDTVYLLSELRLPPEN